MIIKVNAIVLIYQVLVLVTKKQYNSDKQGLEKKIEDVGKKLSTFSGLISKTNYNIILSVTDLAAERLKANKIHDTKCFNTLLLNRLTKTSLDARVEVATETNKPAN